MIVKELYSCLDSKYNILNHVIEPDLIDAITLEISALNKRIDNELKKIKKDERKLLTNCITFGNINISS